MRGRGTTFRNCKRMAINALLEQMCEEGVGFGDLWGYFVGPPSKRKGRSSVLREPSSIDGQWNRLQLFKLVSQGGYTEKPNTRGIDKDSKIHQQRTAWKALRNLGINVFV